MVFVNSVDVVLWENEDREECFIVDCRILVLLVMI